MINNADHCTPATPHLRDTHLQPVDCRGGLFSYSLQPKAHQQVAPPSFAFLPRTGLSSSLAIKHQMDVSAVSGQATRPYPLHYRAAFASSILPPAHPNSAPRGLLSGDTRSHGFHCPGSFAPEGRCLAPFPHVPVGYWWQNTGSHRNRLRSPATATYATSRRSQRQSQPGAGARSAAGTQQRSCWALRSMQRLGVIG